MIEIELNLADDLSLINADPNQLSQVLLNLGTNSKDAMPEGGRLEIETGNVRLDRDFCDLHAEAEPGEYARLSVSDTGHGIDGETLEHIFEPFFTSKDIGRGTGLGLATVHGIINRHGGFVICYSEIGRGTRFNVYLPALLASGLPEIVGEGPKEVRGGREMILLVDDEEAIRELGRKILTRKGYRVKLAGTGEEALEIYRHMGKEIDLVILDISMPGMGGNRCLRDLIEFDPLARVIVASGYSMEGRLSDIRAQGAAEFVAKPFLATDLFTAVRTVLDS